jgi:nitroimidazol reductase NimA-like FMN-containing flavoprotein (pyridoxamine 5'-phosphate oxidase superfamily)
MSDAGDLGRRIFERRAELHLTLAEVAQRAGMAADYIEYLERTPTDLSSASLMRLARALEMSRSELLGGNHGRALGDERAAADPLLTELDRSQCADLLRPGGVGRVVFRAGNCPVAHPVNFRALEGDVVFRSTEGGSVSEIAPDEPVSFEVDRLDDAMSEGWSVLAQGTIHRVSDPAELLQVEALGIQPWAGGTRHAYFRLDVVTLTGRKIEAVR